MISISHLEFGYNKRNSIFESINMTFEEGNIYGLLGENGVGKTTLLRLIAGLLFPRQGKIEVLGLEPRKRSPEGLAEIYYLPETFYSPQMTGARYVDLYHGFYEKFDKEAFDRYTHEFKVDLKKKLSTLSHGQQKKFMISFALACNTRILLMDEPTNGLDITSKSSFRKMIAEAINDTKCFIISTHQVRDLENLIDPIIILEKNQVLINNSLADLGDRLWFGIREKPGTMALYSEEALGGFYVVEPNVNKESSNINIEMLFNATIHNKEWFVQNILNGKKDLHSSSFETEKSEGGRDE